MIVDAVRGIAEDASWQPSILLIGRTRTTAGMNSSTRNARSHLNVHYFKLLNYGYSCRDTESDPPGGPTVATVRDHISDIFGGRCGIQRGLICVNTY